ncbi:BatD family protein [Fibrobacterota bacterium]
MKRQGSCYLCLAILVVLSGYGKTCWCQTAELTVDSRVDKSEITIGDRLRYEINVHYPASGILELPSVLGNLGSFEVKQYDVSEPTKTAAGRERTWEFVLSTFTVGQYTIPPQLVEYTPENDTVRQVIYTEPIVINVKRTSPETVKDIADITGLAVLKAGINKFWILLLVVLAGGCAMAVWIYHRRKQSRNMTPPPKPPYEEAVLLLEQLKKEGLPARQLHKQYCFRLSEILRRYLTRRFAIDALESTTEEFLEKITSIDLTQAQRDRIDGFCRKTDPVKFADFSLTQEEAAEAFKAVDTIVHQTRPRREQDENAGKKTKEKEAPT